jgi:hypothetical protein
MPTVVITLVSGKPCQYRPAQPQATCTSPTLSRRPRLPSAAVRWLTAWHRTCRTSSRQLPDGIVSAAVRRPAEGTAAGTKMVNAPIYRLQHVDISDGHLAATVGMARFADYAMTLDLLEPELIDAIATGKPVTPGSLPLRDYYLPATAALLSGTAVALALLRGASLARICRIQDVCFAQSHARSSMFIRCWQSRRRYRAERLTDAETARSPSWHTRQSARNK